MDILIKKPVIKWLQDKNTFIVYRLYSKIVWMIYNILHAVHPFNGSRQFTELKYSVPVASALCFLYAFTWQQHSNVYVVTTLKQLNNSGRLKWEKLFGIFN